MAYGLKLPKVPGAPSAPRVPGAPGMHAGVSAPELAAIHAKSPGGRYKSGAKLPRLPKI